MWDTQSNFFYSVHIAYFVYMGDIYYDIYTIIEVVTMCVCRCIHKLMFMLVCVCVDVYVFLVCMPLPALTCLQMDYFHLFCLYGRYILWYIHNLWSCDHVRLQVRSRAYDYACVCMCVCVLLLCGNAIRCPKCFQYETKSLISPHIHDMICDIYIPHHWIRDQMCLQVHPYLMIMLMYPCVCVCSLLVNAISCPKCFQDDMKSHIYPYIYDILRYIQNQHSCDHVCLQMHT